MSDTSWICITAIAVVAILALAISFKNNQVTPVSESAVTYEYDDQNRLKSIAPISPSTVILRPIG